MIVYNVTFSVDKDVADEWLSWMKEEHLPSNAKLFEECRILKVLSHQDEHTLSFAVQFYSTSIENIKQYEIPDRFGDRVLAYPTLLEEV